MLKQKFKRYENESLGLYFIRKISEGGLFLFMIVLILFFALKSQYFFSARNFLNVLQSVSVIGITAAGMLMIIVAAGVDLSVGAQMALVGCIQTEIVIEFGLPWYAGILMGMTFGMLCGLLNGLLVTYGDYVPFIATLGTMNVIRGLAYIVSNGQSKYLASPQLEWFGTGRIGAVSVPVILFVLSFFIVWFLLNFTVLGRYIYSIGGNEEAARFAGIPVKTIKLSLYVFTGFLASISGLVLLGLSGSSVPSAGETYGTDIVTAVLLGGGSLRGGKGNIVTTLLGVLTIGLMNNGMTLLNVQQYWQIFAKGLLLIFAVGLDRIRESTSNRIFQG